MKARVVNGRLVLDEPTALPDGSVFDLVLDDEGDELTPEERVRLDEAISRSWKAAREGKARSAEDVIQQLRDRR